MQLLGGKPVNGQIIANVHLPGRFQQSVVQGKQLILDVAHNPAAAHYLADKLLATPCKGRRIALLAMMKDKDTEGIVNALKPCFECWVVADLEAVPRAMRAADVAEVLQSQAISAVMVSDTIEQAYQQTLLTMSADDQLVVFGSFFTVAAVLALQ